MTTAINAFHKTYIWPVNPDVFVDQDYAPSAITDRPDPISPKKPHSSKALDLVKQPITPPTMNRNKENKNSAALQRISL